MTRLDTEDVWANARVFVGPEDILESMPTGGSALLVGVNELLRETVVAMAAPEELTLSEPDLLALHGDAAFGWAWCSDPAADAAEVLRVCRVAIFDRYSPDGQMDSVDAAVAAGGWLVIGVVLGRDHHGIVLTRLPEDVPDAQEA